MSNLQADSSTPSSAEQAEKQPKAQRGPYYKGPFISTTPFENVAERVAAVRKQMQGRSLDRDTLSDLWSYKGGGNVDQMLRSAVDFGLFELDDPDKKRALRYKLSELGLHLSLAQRDSREWLRLAAQSIRSSQFASQIFERFGLDVTQTQLVIYCHRLTIKQWLVDTFIPVFLKNAEIVKRAENIVETSRVETAAAAPVVAPAEAASRLAHLEALLAEMRQKFGIKDDDENSKAAAASAPVTS